MLSGERLEYQQRTVSKSSFWNWLVINGSKDLQTANDPKDKEIPNTASKEYRFQVP